MYNLIGHFELDYLGCSSDELFNHIESLFKEGMCWEGYDNIWSISIPTPRKEGTNDKLSESEIIANFHYSKLRVVFLSEVTYSWP